MKILQAPSAALSRKAVRVKKINKDILDLVADMKQALIDAHDPDGVGLAAPQVGRDLQIFIIKDHANWPFVVYINPAVTIHHEHEKTDGKKEDSKNENVQLEGCLSLKDIWGKVRRAKHVTVEYMDENGEKHIRDYEGFPATIVQHEYDHLHGILFPKRVLEQKGQLYKSHKNEKGEDEFEEIEI